jgi:hypothetical protein
MHPRLRTDTKQICEQRLLAAPLPIDRAPIEEPPIMVSARPTRPRLTPGPFFCVQGSGRRAGDVEEVPQEPKLNSSSGFLTMSDSRPVWRVFIPRVPGRSPFWVRSPAPGPRGVNWTLAPPGRTPAVNSMATPCGASSVAGGGPLLRQSRRSWAQVARRTLTTGDCGVQPRAS